MSDKRKNNKREEFLRYSGKKIQGEERNAFERGLQKDPFEAEATEGFEIISEKDARKDLGELDKLLGRGEKKGNRFIFLRIAASIAVLVVVSVLFYFLSDRQLKDVPGQMTITESQEKRIPEKDGFEPKGDISEENIKREDKKSSSGEISKPGKSEGNEEPGEGTIPAITDQIEGKGAIPAKKDQTDLNSQSEPESSEEMFEFFSETEPAKESILSEAGDSGIPSKKARSAKADVSTKEIHGSVISSEDKSPLPGVVIVVKGSSHGTVSDIDGNFKIPVESDSGTLIVSYVGMEQEEIIANTNKDVFISMEPTYASLDEVVVIGYGTTRSDQTGAVSDVKINQISEEPTYSPAIPEGGKRAFEDYIKNNMKFPDSDSVKQKEVVVVRFRIGTNGFPHSFNVVRSPNDDFSKEAIRLIREGPVWLPAKSGDEFIEEETRIRIVFESP